MKIQSETINADNFDIFPTENPFQVPRMGSSVLQQRSPTKSGSTYFPGETFEFLKKQLSKRGSWGNSGTRAGVLVNDSVKKNLGRMKVDPAIRRKIASMF